MSKKKKQTKKKAKTNKQKGGGNMCSPNLPMSSGSSYNYSCFTLKDNSNICRSHYDGIFNYHCKPFTWSNRQYSRNRNKQIFRWCHQRQFTGYVYFKFDIIWV